MIDIFIFVLLGIWLLAQAILVGASFLVVHQKAIPVDTFVAQLHKLIMANNLDRAIKLCNVAHEAPFSKAAKNLLCVANRPYRLEMEYQTGRLELLQFKTGRFAWANTVVNIGTALTILAGFIISVETPLSQGLLLGAVLLYLFFKLLIVLYNQKLIKNTAGALPKLMSLRNTLYLRRQSGTALDNPNKKTLGYLPPAYSPREDFTQEELAAWRASMNEFESGMKKRRDAGEDFDIAEEYTRQADSDGVLPPI